MAAGYAYTSNVAEIMRKAEAAAIDAVNIVNATISRTASDLSPVGKDPKEGDEERLYEAWYEIEAQRLGSLVMGGVSNRKDYWIYVELGTRYMAARLPGRRAMDMEAPRLLTEFAVRMR